MNIYTNKLRHFQTLLVLLLFLTGLFSTTCSFAQQKASQDLPDAGSKVQADPWTAEDLLAPSDLARGMEAGPNSQLPLILSVGPAAMIKGSQDIGAAAQPENLTKLKETLDKLPKDKPIVIYCGCCPFAHCPNVRPAFNLIKKMHFTHAKLLNLEHNIRTDWIDKGYPTQQ